MRRTAKRSPARRSTTGAIILIGLVLLIWTGHFWPWILALIGLASLPDGIARGGPIAGAAPAVWLVALAWMIASGTLWPGVLFLVGVPILLSAAVRGQRR